MLYLQKKRIVSKDKSDARAIIKAVGDISGVNVDTEKGTVSLPLEPRLMELAAARGAIAPLSSDIVDWYKDVTRRETNHAKIIAKDDAVILNQNSSLLRPYQRVGSYATATLSRLLLADDMGLGKTAQAVVAVSESRDKTKVLVVCPSSVKGTWLQEIEKWYGSPTPKVLVAQANKRKKQLPFYCGGFVVVNYELFRQDSWFTSGLWDWVIFDEAHRLKNRDTETFRAAKKVRAKNLLLMTGTPFGNNPGELWSLLNLLHKEKYPSYWRFFDMYVDYIEDEWSGTREIIGPKNESLLRKDLSTIMVRRMKSEMSIQLPPKVYQTIPLSMLEKQSKVYKEAVKDTLRDLDGDRINTFQPMVKLLRLRQILSTPATLGFADDSAKLDALVDIVTGTQEQVVVFTLFRPTVESVQQRLEEKELPFSTIVGGMKPGKADQAILDFNQKRTKVMICTIGAGGIGLNLQTASIAVFVDKHYNPVMQSQAEDRIHRLGQVASSVQIIDLYCPGTVDDVVNGILSKKIEMINSILGEALINELERYLKDGRDN